VRAQSTGLLYVKSRVAMDFSGEHGRVVADPNEALGVAFEEGYNWRVGFMHGVVKLLDAVEARRMAYYVYVM